MSNIYRGIYYQSIFGTLQLVVIKCHGIVQTSNIVYLKPKCGNIVISRILPSHGMDKN